MTLKDKLALITGGSGSIGTVITKRYLEEGAKVIITGRNREKLENTCRELAEADKTFKERIHFVVLDGADIKSVKEGMKQISAFGPIDILINNAGSAGPMQVLYNIPVTQSDLEELKKQGSNDKETLKDAVGSLLGGPWLMTCALLPYLKKGASVINVSTIFSRTDYFGRIPYVIPKAALNKLSHLMAEELGNNPWSIRVNTVFPGPVDSERLRKVFTAMDKLKQLAPGSTSNEILAEMALKEHDNQGNFLSKEEIANFIVFLGSSESSGVSNHDFEVTHALHYSDVDTSGLILDAEPMWILAGENIEEALSYSQKHCQKGTEFLITFRTEEIAESAQKLFAKAFDRCTIASLAPENTFDWEKIKKLMSERSAPRSLFVLPRLGAKDFIKHYGNSVIQLSLETIQDFLDREINEMVLIARGLAKFFQMKGKASIYFINHADDGNGNKFEKIRKEALHQLLRSWRYENKFQGIDLTVSDDIQHDFFTQHKKSLNLINEKVAYVTGGSEGIGREVTRSLLERGAIVMIASRSQAKLENTRNYFLQEMAQNGISNANSKLLTSVCDVTDPKSIEDSINAVIAQTGRIDILINNAGIPGQELSIVDIPLDGWRQTMQANLISNYDLIMRSLPYMKKQQTGHIVCVSSQLGGVGNAIPSYPNRADYAVTKAGQRGLADAFANLLGPDVQINTVAPGPVEGERVKGGVSPGLYKRRAKINTENKRLNSIYNFLAKLKCNESEFSELLDTLALNAFSKIRESKGISQELLHMVEGLSSASIGKNSGSATHLLTKDLAHKLLSRLRKAKKIPSNYTEERFLKSFEEPKPPFISDDEITKDSDAIMHRTLESLSLGHMPSEHDIGEEIAFNITDLSMTGETLYPSCGYHLGQVSIRGQFLDTFDPTLFERLHMKKVLIIGDAMYDVMVKIAEAYLKGKNLESIILVVFLRVVWNKLTPRFRNQIR